ncbi:Arginine deiminase OS=Streptomyces fumanus OX=67302 GN=arcA PE=3 SV=1 [Streptomyces fumanus]
MGFHVDSEAGRLRRVILHRPDLELKRLTPSDEDALLFDDVLWVRRARARRVRRRAARPGGVEVHLFGDLLAETQDARRPGNWSWTRYDEKEYGVWPPTTCGPPSRRCPAGSWPRRWWAG